MSEIQEIPNFGVGKNFEAAVIKLENDLKSIADGKSIVAGTKDKPIVNDSDQIPIDHFFMDGVYIRKMTMFQGYVVIGAIHKHKHMCFLLEGPGEKRILYAHKDSHWYNTHKNPDNTEDVEELEKQIVAISYEEYKKYKEHGKNK